MFPLLSWSLSFLLPVGRLSFPLLESVDFASSVSSLHVLASVRFLVSGIPFSPPYSVWSCFDSLQLEVYVFSLLILHALCSPIDLGVMPL